MRCGRSARGGPGESTPCCRTFLHRCPPRELPVRFQPAFGGSFPKKTARTFYGSKNSSGSILFVGNFFFQKVLEKSCVQTHKFLSKSLCWETVMMKNDSLRAGPPIGRIASTKSSKVTTEIHHPPVPCKKHMNQPEVPSSKTVTNISKPSKSNQKSRKQSPEMLK